MFLPRLLVVFEARRAFLQQDVYGAEEELVRQVSEAGEPAFELDSAGPELGSQAFLIADHLQRLQENVPFRVARHSKRARHLLAWILGTRASISRGARCRLPRALCVTHKACNVNAASRVL